ncbi:VWA domain-containing protein [Pedobacter sp. Du54]|uniref:VWA domain-containing protein n=1 Tax=Pedobacter anseongensis TaxID=3133439 RepID=UPI0030A96B55
MRRQPLFILVDNSSSTIGQPIQQVNDFINLLIKEAKSDPFFLEALQISLIEFGSKVPKCILGLQELDKVKLHRIFPTTEKRYLGRAIELLSGKIKKNLIPSTKDQRGDQQYFLLIFLFGESEGDYQIQISELKKGNPKPRKVILIGLNKYFLIKQKDLTKETFDMREVKSSELLKMMNLFPDDFPLSSEKA